MKIGAPAAGEYPAAMRASTRWINWKYLNGKKPPCGPDGAPLKEWSDPANWLTWEAAANNMADNPDLLLGFVLGADEEGSWIGVDLDHCRNPEDGIITNEKAAGLVDYLRDVLGVWVETSPSGSGFKAFGRGDAPEWVEVNYGVEPPELGGDRAVRFFAVTGHGTGDPTQTLNLMGIKAVVGPGDGTGGRDAPEDKHNPLPEVVHAGGQNTALFREACRHVRQGKTKDEVFAWVKITQLQRCPPAPGAPSWTDSDFWAIVNSAMRYAPADDTFKGTESGDAECFAHLHGDNVRFNHRTDGWLHFDGVRWRPQMAGEVEHLALDTVRWRQVSALKVDDHARREAAAKWAAGGERMSRRNNLLEACKMEVPINSVGDEWDQDPWLLGVRNGVVDLRTGTLRPGKPEDHITKQCAVPFDAGAPCPLWDATVADIFKDNPDLVPYIQRALGYALTGDTREEVFFLLIGNGRNGKGTVMNTVEAILGDYTTNLSMRSLEASRHGTAGSAASPDIAKLAGARLVTASETSGGSFNTALLKGLTGRDAMSARHLHAEEFTFVPVLKLFISLNEQPRVSDQSIGFWERPHMIPFNQCYAANPDRTLKDRLLEEAEGILAWCVRGCLAWQSVGLGKPSAVTKAVAAYKESQEPLTEFLDERCVLHHDASSLNAALHEEYKTWAKDRGVWARDMLSGRAFAKALGNRPGLESRHTNRGKEWLGIGVAGPEKEF